MIFSLLINNIYIMKKCKRCNIEKLNIEFSISKNSKDGLNSWCKSCKSEYSRYRNLNRVLKKIDKKRCSLGLVDKEIDNFSKGNTDDGFNIWCKSCQNEYNKKYYIENKERLKPIRKKWTVENKDKFKYYQRERYIKIDSERLRKYYEDNKIEIKAKRDEYKKTEQYKKWLIEYKIKNSWKNRYRDILKSVIRRIGQKKQNKTVSILGYSSLDFKIHIESKFKSDMNWEEGRNKFHIDHIIPIVAFREDTPLDIINSLDNLRPLYTTENLQKNSNIDYDEIDIYIKYLEYLNDEYFKEIKDYIEYISKL